MSVNKGISALESFFDEAPKPRVLGKKKRHLQTNLKKLHLKIPKISTKPSKHQDLLVAKNAAITAAKAASKAYGDSAPKSKTHVSIKKANTKDFDNLIKGDFNMKKADKSLADLEKYWGIAKNGIAKSKAFKAQVIKQIGAARDSTKKFLTKIGTKLQKAGPPKVAPKAVVAPAKPVSGKVAAPAKPAVPAKKVAAKPATPAKKK